MKQLSSLRADDILPPESYNAEEVPVNYCSGKYLIGKGRQLGGKIYYTVLGDEWSGYKTADSLAGIKRIIWEAQP